MEKVIEPFSFNWIIENNFAKSFPIQGSITRVDDVSLIGEMISDCLQSRRAWFDNLPSQMIQIDHGYTVWFE